jgi:adenylate cyclase
VNVGILRFLRKGYRYAEWMTRGAQLAVSERKLAAVMFTDIVGYTAMSQRNEKHALKVLESHNDLLRPIFGKHGGTEVKTIGDSFLVEFASALAATECAIEIQQKLAEFSKDQKDSPIIVRIGLHLGDVVRRGHDIFGDAVNIASRIQPLAEPGGICLSEEVYSVIRNKIPYPVELVPEVSLKNVELPMNIYTIHSLSIAGEERQNLEDGTTRLAVLPLANISPDPKDAYFADGMTEELITVLSQVQGLRVIARTSVDRYSKREKSVAQIAKELRVGSVMEGSVRMAGDRIRVTVQLVNGRSEEHLWSEKYDRKLDDIFEIQTEIAKHVAKSLKVKLLQGEVDRMESRAPENASAYSAYLKGRTLLVSRREEDIRAAKELFESAIALDPAYAPAYSGLADATSFLGKYSATPQPTLSRHQARELVSKALELNPDLAEARATLGLILAEEYDFAGAEKELRRATSLNPSYSNAHYWLGYFVLGAKGRYRESFEEFKMAELADPTSIVVLFNQFIWLMLYFGNKEEAAKKAAKANQLYPGHQFTRAMNAFYEYYTGNYSRAIKLLLESNEIDEKRGDFAAWPELVCAYSAMGNGEEARKWLAKIESLPEDTESRSIYFAVAHAGLGELDEFFTWARRASEEKAWEFGRLRLIDREIPAMRNIRQDPRWVELFKKVGLEA